MRTRKRYKINFKKILVFTLAVVFFVSALNISAFAAEESGVLDGEQAVQDTSQTDVEISAEPTVEPSPSASAEPSVSAGAEPNAVENTEPSATPNAEVSAGPSAAAEPSEAPTAPEMNMLGKGKPEPRKYTVTYNSNGYFTAPSDSGKYTQGEEVTVLEGDKAAHDQSGKHVFIGWSTSKNDKMVNTSAQYQRLIASGRFYAGGDTYIMGNGSVTFYAVFGSTAVPEINPNPQPVAETFPATYYILKDGLTPPGDAKPDKPANYTKVGTGTILESTPVPVYNNTGDGILQYLVDIPDCSGLVRAGEAVRWYVVKYDASDGYHVDGVVYKQAIHHTVRFYDADGTSLLDSQTVEDKEPVNEYAYQAPSGYAFVGWYLLENGVKTDKEVVSASFERVSSSFDVYAKTVPVSEITLTANSDNSKIYNGSQQTVSGYTGVPEGLTITGVKAQGSGTDAGIYTVAFTQKNAVIKDANGRNVTDQYKIEYVTGTLTIGKAGLTVTAEDKTRMYGVENPELTYTLSGLKGSDTLEGIGLTPSISTTAAASSPAGDYPITVAGDAETKNYDVSYVNGTLKITNSNMLAVAATAYSGTYDAESHDGIIDVSPSIAGAEITYSTDGVNYSPDMPRFTDAGSYPVYVRAEAPNYNPAATRVTAVIGKASLTVTAEDKEKTYGEDNPAFTAAYSGFVNGEDETVLAGTLTFDSAANAASPVADYAIVPSGLESANYEITFVDGTLAVNPKNITVTPANAQKVYGSSDPLLNAAVDGLVGSDTLSFTVTRETGENVGKYGVRVTVESNPNYVVEAGTATFTITPKEITVTADNKTKTEGQADPALTAVVSGLAVGDRLQYKLGRDAGEMAGTYAIHVTPGSNPNYIVKTVNAVLTITAAPAEPATPVTPTTPTAPDAPAGGTTATPTGGATPAAGDTVTVPDSQTPLAGSEGNNNTDDNAEQEPVTIKDNQTPLAGGIGQASWALLNLILAIATGIIMIVLLIGYFFGKKKKEDKEDEAVQSRMARGEDGEEQGKLKRRGIIRLLSVIPTVVAIIAFILTENIWNPMVWIDKWTLLMAAIAIVQVIVAIFTKKSRKDKEDEEPEEGIHTEHA